MPKKEYVYSQIDVKFIISLAFRKQNPYDRTSRYYCTTKKPEVGPHLSLHLKRKQFYTGTRTAANTRAYY